MDGGDVELGISCLRLEVMGLLRGRCIIRSDGGGVEMFGR